MAKRKDEQADRQEITANNVLKGFDLAIISKFL